MSPLEIPWPCNMRFKMAQCTHPYQKSDGRAHDGRFSGENLHVAHLRETVPHVAELVLSVCWVGTGVAEFILDVAPQSSTETAL